MTIGRQAVVFAYHDVGVRGLAALLACGVDVKLVVSHQDNPEENIWFGSVRELARLNDIPVICPTDPNTPEVLAEVKNAQPDWLFSFYYRHMLGADLLAVPGQGAFNLHGSLLPKYRGRVPVNWAIIHGEAETGVSLHEMVLKPDAGGLIDRERVPILPNDTAQQVFQKVTCAAECLLMRSVPRLLDGSASATPLDLPAGSYFGGRKPEDGRIDWSQSARQIHNLIRAVAPPYPGAFFDIDGGRIQMLGSYYRHEEALGSGVRLYWQNGYCRADCADGRRLCITRLEFQGQVVLSEANFCEHFGAELPLSAL